MYRPSNDRYSENNALPQMSGAAMGGHMGMGNYPPPPHHDFPKPPAPPDNSYPNYPPLQHMYYEGTPPPPYDYLPPANPPSDSYDPRFPAWRDTSQPKGMQMMGMGGHFRPPGYHEPYPPAREPPKAGPAGEGFASLPPAQPQVNVVQRLAGIIKSQLPLLQSTMLYADKKTYEERLKKDRSRSRSPRDRPRRHSRERDRPPHREWNCPKCAFLNFDFRDRCKRCNESKPESLPRYEPISTTGKNYVPGPQDWRCNKCNNINYARRTECHRCHAPRNK